MNFGQWKQLSGRQQNTITKSWNLGKNEGQKTAAAVLKVFVEQYRSNKDIEIDAEIIKLRDNAGWAIGVQCLNEAGLQATPKNYMGIPVSRLHIDHVEDGVFSDLVPPRLSQRFPDKSSSSFEDE